MPRPVSGRKSPQSALATEVKRDSASKGEGVDGSGSHDDSGSQEDQLNLFRFAIAGELRRREC